MLDLRPGGWRAPHYRPLVVAGMVQLHTGLCWAKLQSMTSQALEQMEHLKGTRLWGGFGLKISDKFDATLSMMLLLLPSVKKEFHLIQAGMHKQLQATA